MTEQVSTTDGGTITPPEHDLQPAREALFQTGSQYLPVNKDDIAGIDEKVKRIESIADYLNNHQQYIEHGVRIEPGLMLSGRPGTGKTMLVRYLATLTDTLFVNVREWPRTSDILTEDDIRELFQLARRTYALNGRPIILFWDEFETNAKVRTKATPAQAAAVSQLTAEIDGVQGKCPGILLVGCTNYADDVDPALKRAGRMGTRLHFSRLTRYSREKVLNYYLGRHPHQPGMDLASASRILSAKNAAEVEEAVMDVWHQEVRRSLNDGGTPVIQQQQLIDVFMDRLIAEQGAQQVLTATELHRVAIHEIGHAVAAYCAGFLISAVTIRATSSALGVVFWERQSEGVKTLLEDYQTMQICLASREAERLFGCPASTGANGDIEYANRAARRLVEESGAGRTTGYRSAAIQSSRASESSAYAGAISPGQVERFDVDINEFLTGAHNDVETLFANIPFEALTGLVNRLLEAKTLTGTEFEQLIEELFGHDLIHELKDMMNHPRSDVGQLVYGNKQEQLS